MCGGEFEAFSTSAHLLSVGGLSDVFDRLKGHACAFIARLSITDPCVKVLRHDGPKDSPHQFEIICFPDSAPINGQPLEEHSIFPHRDVYLQRVLSLDFVFYCPSQYCTEATTYTILLKIDGMCRWGLRKVKSSEFDFMQEYQYCPGNT